MEFRALASWTSQNWFYLFPWFSLSLLFSLWNIYFPFCPKTGTLLPHVRQRCSISLRSPLTFSLFLFGCPNSGPRYAYVNIFLQPHTMLSLTTRHSLLNTHCPALTCCSTPATQHSLLNVHYPTLILNTHYHSHSPLTTHSLLITRCPPLAHYSSLIAHCSFILSPPNPWDEFHQQCQ